MKFEFAVGKTAYPRARAVRVMSNPPPQQVKELGNRAEFHRHYGKDRRE